MPSGLLWASIVSALGLTLMGAIALLVQPPHVEIARLGDHLGATVTTEGLVQGVTDRTQGYSRMLLADANASVELIAQRPFNVSTGDRVRATGQVGAHAGKIQIHVEAPAQDVQVLVRWRDNHVPLERILDQPWSYRDLHVRTSGHLQDRMLRAAATGQAIPIRGVPANLQGSLVVDTLVAYDAARAQFHLHILAHEPLLAP